MGYKETVVGGQPTQGLPQDFTNFLQNFINTGSFGSGTAGQQAGAATPVSDTQDIFGLLNSIISNPSADQSVQDLISKDIERGRNDLRARFGTSGGMGFGTPAAFAESLFQAEQVPRTTLALDELSRNRLASLMPFFQQAGALTQQGTPQAQATLQPDAFSTALNAITGLAGAATNIFSIPGIGGNVGVPNQPNIPNVTPGLTPPTIQQPPPGTIRTPGGPINYGFTPLPFNQYQQYYS